ncbi:MAG: hypothetical protein KFF46_01825 [Desulfobacterales bacterium]|nr:hypothetical protein [Desulfobacterales bacterium]
MSELDNSGKLIGNSSPGNSTLSPYSNSNDFPVKKQVLPHIFPVRWPWAGAGAGCLAALARFWRLTNRQKHAAGKQPAPDPAHAKTLPKPVFAEAPLARKLLTSVRFIRIL